MSTVSTGLGFAAGAEISMVLRHHRALRRVIVRHVSGPERKAYGPSERRGHHRRQRRIGSSPRDFARRSRAQRPQSDPIGIHPAIYVAKLENGILKQLDRVDRFRPTDIVRPNFSQIRYALPVQIQQVLHDADVP